MGFVKQGSPEKGEVVCGYPTDPIEKIEPTDKAPDDSKPDEEKQDDG